jgi:hypothetical protein
LSEASSLTLTIYPEDARTFGPCDCCGQMTSRVWGYVYKLGDALAVYYVEWTPGHETSAHFDIILGTWGDETQKPDRKAISLEYRVS